jgi:CelD/BcsL family acetyltransferase involved in cellulose biosynthesis
VTSPKEIGDTLEWMRVHKGAWMEKRGLRTDDGDSDVAEHMRDFYRAFATDSEYLRVATLTFDGNVVAAVVGFLFEGTFSAAISTYDPALEKLAPGAQLLAELLRWTLDNGCAIFDFMPYGERYKYLWAPEEARITTYLIPCSLRGRVLVAWRRSRVGATVQRLVRLRAADIPRIVRKRLLRRSA